MAGKRDKPKKIVLELRQVEVLQGQGSSIADAVSQIGVTRQTYYRWRKRVWWYEPRSVEAAEGA